MIVTGMEEFQNICKQKLKNWYNDESNGMTEHINSDDVFVVWSCKSLQNYKCLLSTTVPRDGIYAEYTYSGDYQKLFEDVYKKMTNTCYDV